MCTELPHSVRKDIAVRVHRRIKDDAIAEDVDTLNVDQGCVDVDLMIEQYDDFSSDLLDMLPRRIYMW